MRQQTAELRFVDEHADELAILRQMREHPLDHQDALETFRPDRDRQEDLGHPARADPIQQVVLPERLRTGENRRVSLGPHALHGRPISAEGPRF